MATTKKGFIIDLSENKLLPITRAELVLDSKGRVALHSKEFLAQDGLPGLITSGERALINQLSGSGEGQNLADIYIKLDHINNGLKVNNTSVHFYDNAGSTPITITTTKDTNEDGSKIPTLDLSVQPSQTITIGLNILNAAGLSASGILRSITVDKYGRVTAVSGSDLTNEDIPNTLTGKVLSGATTSTSEIADNDLAVVNKAYVDDKFDAINSVATGALVFKGTLSDKNSALGVLNNNNCYYKVIGSFDIGKDYIYTGDNSTSAGMDITVKTGDTLIIKDNKFVYIPSGDEKETFITVGKKNETSILNKALGEVTFTFDGPFTVTQGSGNIANISITEASDKTNGYLSADDYKKFNSYASLAATTYDGDISSDVKGAYKIGTLTVANYPYDIYGINNTYSLSLATGTYNLQNCPTLKFTENDSVYLYNIYGYNGINVEVDDKTLKLSSTNKVIESSEPYLNIINNHLFEIKIGSLDASTGEINSGLVDYEEFHNYKQSVFNSTVTFAVIENSLTDPNYSYSYGSDALTKAINVTI